MNEPPDDAALSEQEYLQREAERTQAALASTLEDLKDSLRTAADVRLWTARHPWAALGVAAASGFAVASAFQRGGTKENAAPSTNGAVHQPAVQQPIQQAAASGPPQRGAITGLLFDLAKVALQSSILAAGQAAAAHQNPSDPPPEPPDPTAL